MVKKVGLLLGFCLASGSAQAQESHRDGFQARLWSLSPATVSVAADSWIRTAIQAEGLSKSEEAIKAWNEAADLAPELFEVAALRTTELKLDAGLPVDPETLSFLRTLKLPGVPRALARSTGALADVVSGLKSDDRDAICADLAPTIDKANDGIAQAFYGACTAPDEFEWRKSAGFSPNTDALLNRAQRLKSEVRFTTANQALDAIDESKMSAQQVCDFEYLKGQVVYRLRQRDTANKHYRNAVEHCEGIDADSHIRALYALGKREFETGQLEESKAAYSALVKLYPKRSHADDAYMYLARIARQQGDQGREAEIVNTVLTKLPDGDMVFEIVWENLESAYRAGEYRSFINGLAAMKLPAHDGEYFSQGRLEYFRGRAFEKLGELDSAKESLGQAWSAYPFSFYGYLSREVLKDRGWAVPDLAQSVIDPPWLEASQWRYSAAARLLRAGAADRAGVAAKLFGRTPEDLWRMSYALDRAGLYPQSHNIVRRSISGAPWLEDGGVNLVQMKLAWPNPFEALIEAACAAELEQSPETYLNPALPTSIMREESSFIEDIESYAGALGLMQLMPRTALGHDDDVNGAATPDRLKTAPVNIRVGVDHLFYLSRKFKGHPALIAAAYNAGGGAVGKWISRQPNEDIALFIEDIPPLQTRDYTKRVVGSYAAYTYLRGEELDPRILGAAQ